MSTTATTKPTAKPAGIFSKDPFINVTLLPLDDHDAPPSTPGIETLMLDARTIEAISDRVETQGSFTIHTIGGHSYKCNSSDLMRVKATWISLKG